MDVPEALARRLFSRASPRPGFMEAAEEALLDLAPRDREVLLRRLSGESLAAIASALGISRERIRQYEARAIHKLRPRLVRFIEILPRPECLPLLPEDIEAILAEAIREQGEAWREFRQAFSPEQNALWREYWRRRGDPGRAIVWEQFIRSLTDDQRALWRAYRRASAYTQRVRRALQRARAGEDVYSI